MRMAYGHVVPQDIRWMTEEMDKFGKDKPVILVTHYPLLDGDVVKCLEMGIVCDFCKSLITCSWGYTAASFNYM